LAASIGFIPLDKSYFLWLIATMVAYMVLAQTVKTIYIRRYGQWF
jgi:Mg2+-importing ATPase